MTDAPLAAEAQDLLAGLLRLDTVNPPGNERPAQELLAEHLGEAGLECEMLGAEPERPNLIARLPGRAPGPTLCLLGHVDTVLADPRDWSVDPWSGELQGGFLWGRGALDMKDQVAAEAAAVASLARSGWRPERGELILVSVVDEETGGELGARWLTENHPDRVRCDMLLNEGGGAVFEIGGRRIYGVCCAEKGVYRFTLRTHGVAGHASMPAMGDNALIKMAPLLARLGERSPQPRVVPEARLFLERIGDDPDDPVGAVARLAASDPALAVLFGPMLAVTFTPTKIAASEKVNVIPGRAELKVDCRVPPGLGESAVREDIIDVLGDDGFELEFNETVAGNGSRADSPLMDAIDRWVKANDEGAETVPLILPGFSDSRWFREAFPDCVAYGFFPQRHQTMLEAAPLIHNADERIDVRDLGFAADFYYDLARNLLG